MGDLAELLERVKAATGPDRLLDLAIAQALGQQWSYTGEPPKLIYCAHVTASQDAALALVERVLPRSYPGVQQNWYPAGDPLDGSWNGYVTVGGVETGTEYEGDSRPTPALALLAAMLSALIAQKSVGDSKLTRNA